jgi:F420-non-reducing hydrogenase iron-sulfur subunit
VVAFCCNWCSYAGADLAGVSRLQYPANIRIIRLMCTGRLEPVFVLKAFEWGADGIIVSGCHPGDCHYISGNEKAQVKVEEIWKLLDLLGIERDRLRLQWVSASEGQKFADSITEFVEMLRGLEDTPFQMEMAKEEAA